MTKADTYLYNDINHILHNGFIDQNPRPHYADGKPAHTISVNHVMRSYDLDKGEFPICTLRPQAWKTGLRELFAIYQNQSNKISEFERLGCKWWKDWALADGTIGRSYPYNLESHRLNETKKEIVNMDARLVDEKFSKKFFTCEKRIVHDLGYLGNIEKVCNYTDAEICILRKIWEKMFEDTDGFVHQEWHSFETFLRDVRYVPQYFLAREDDFKGWKLSRKYYRSNAYSKETCVFLNEEDIFDETNEDKRYELSRNQVVELIRDIRENPYGRRHIMSFWNFANINKKALVECAYETIWNVRGEYLDMVLIQRSGDMLTASGAGGINEIQYAALLMMIAKSVGMKVGKFTHFVANEQIYDRHIETAHTLMERYETEKAKECPILVLDTKKHDFFDFTLDDFCMERYEPIKPQLTLELGI